MPGSCALLSLGFLVGRASPSSGLMPALDSCLGWPAMVVAGASGEGVSRASAARGAGGAPGATNQRASASDPIADLGCTSSSIATGTSGSAGFTFAAATGCGASTRGAGPVVSAVAVGPNESAMTERVAPIANNNANASHMTLCFIAASPRPIEQKIRRIPQVRDGAWQLQNQFGLVRGRLMALAGRPRGKRRAAEARAPRLRAARCSHEQPGCGAGDLSAVAWCPSHPAAAYCPSFASLPCFAASIARSASSGNSSRSATCRAASRRTAAT